MNSSDEEVLWQGRFLEIRKADGRWEYATRPHDMGAVMIFALTSDQKMILVEEFRLPIRKPCICAPAGLCGDEQKESEECAAQRELLEEAGYAADSFTFLFNGPSSPGLTSESVSFFLAKGLHRIGKGGGVDTEDITVHEVPLQEADAWLDIQREEGKVVDPRVYTGLYFLKKLYS